jgi:hypothetical protein
LWREKDHLLKVISFNLLFISIVLMAGRNIAREQADDRTAEIALKLRTTICVV